MRTSRALEKQIVETYATVLYDAATAEDSVDAVGADLDRMMRVVRGHADLRAAMLDDSLPSENRVGVLDSVFTDVHPAVRGMFRVLVEEENFDALPAIVARYDAVAETRRGVVAVDVTTAVPLSETLREAITAKLSADLGRDVVLREKLDPGIVGGIIIDAAGRRIDASIVSQLETARAVLSTTAFTGGGA